MGCPIGATLTLKTIQDHSVTEKMTPLLILGLTGAVELPGIVVLIAVRIPQDTYMYVSLMFVIQQIMNHILRYA